MNNYGELKTTIARWANRADIAADIPLIVDLCEREIYRGLRCDDNQFVATYNNTSWQILGHPAAATTYGVHILLPPNFKHMELVKWNGRPLEEISYQRIARRLLDVQDAQPFYFARRNRLVLFSQAINENTTEWNDEDELEYHYYGWESLNALPTYQVGTNPVETPPVEDTSPQDNSQSDANTTRLFQMNPDLYLHGCLYFTGLFLREDAMAQKWGGLFNSALADLRGESVFGEMSGSTSAVSSVYEDSAP